MSLIRDTPLGRIIRWSTSNRLLQHAEEQEDFELPAAYRDSSQDPILEIKPIEARAISDAAQPDSDLTSKASDEGAKHHREEVEERVEDEAYRTAGIHDGPSRPADLERAQTQHSQASKATGTAITPTRTREGHILVDFYTADDPEHPQNWPVRKKILASSQLYIYTFAVYLSSSIVTPSFPGIRDEFGVSQTEVSLLLALYVLFYGWGSLPAASLSEIPSIGRNPPYMVTFGLFVAISIALPLVHNFPALAVLRFLQGAFGAPCLATGGASLADMWSFAALPYAICAWAVAATAGPSLGPLISSYSVTAENWRWSFWEILWLAGPVFISMFCLLPETFVPNILLRKAQRLRRITGNQSFKSQSELDQANTSPRQLAWVAFSRPFLVNALDPVVLFTTLYVSLVYGTYYSFFEAFPIVFARYNFDPGEQGLAFLSIAVAVFVAVTIYVCYLRFHVGPRMRIHGPGEPEERLTLGVVCSLLLPIGLFIFAWTSNGVIHWIVPLLGIFIFTVGVFILIQLIFAYLPTIYDYRYVASIFAANNAARSSVAFAAVLFSTPMFNGIGIGGGVSLLAGFAVICSVGMLLLRVYGKAMRGRSRFTNKM